MNCIECEDYSIDNGVNFSVSRRQYFSANMDRVKAIDDSRNADSYRTEIRRNVSVFFRYKLKENSPLLWFISTSKDSMEMSEINKEIKWL